MSEETLSEYAPTFEKRSLAGRMMKDKAARNRRKERKEVAEAKTYKEQKDARDRFRANKLLQRQKKRARKMRMERVKGEKKTKEAQTMSMQEVKLEGWSQRKKAKSNESLVDQIAYYARVSNPSSQITSLKNDGLINYLIRHKHWSPFEMVNVCLEVNTTRDIGRQLIRHRSFSFQEFSQRYAETGIVTSELREARMQDHVNRQNSLETDDEALGEWWEQKQAEVMKLCFDAYDEALEKDIAKEVARAVLPEGLTWTRLYVNGSIRSWIHYIDLRTDPSTQKEHRELAHACARELAQVFPMIENFVHE